MVSLGTLTMLAALAAAPSDQPVLLDFTATWCTPCRMMEKTVERLEREGYQVQKVDIDLQPQVAAQYGVRQIPCFVMVSGGREVDRVVGPTTFARLQRMFLVASDAMRPIVAQTEHQRRDGNGWPGDVAEQPLGPRTSAPAGQSLVSRQPRHDSVPSVEGRQLEETNLRSRGASPIDRALAATVRITVEDQNHNSYGTGSIIDTHGEEVLILTCGHIFRASQGRGQIQVDLFFEYA